MRRLLTTLLILLFGVANAQNYLHVNITEINDWQTYTYCTSQYDGVVIAKEPSCTSWWCWSVSIGGQLIIDGATFDELTLTIPENINQYYTVSYLGCDIWEREFYVRFIDFQAPEPWTQDYMWKRTGTSVHLEAYGGYNYQWSNGSTNNSITVTEPGTYWVRIYNDCGELYDTIQVRDNVEIDLATCDLESNLNIVTWPTTPAQAEYVDHVIIKRDGVQVGTANYADGYFLDNIGSDAASRTYTVVAVDPDGAQCPIASHPKETIHMSYTLGMGNTIEMGWNTPTGYDLMGYNICEWHPNGTLNVIDFVGASVTSYTCTENLFNNGYVVVQGVENSKTESRLLSNRSEEGIVGLGEQSSVAFEVYPNPSNGVFTVKGTGTLRIANVLGQETMVKEIDGKETVALPQGMYFVRLNGAVRKIVVE